jgi:hypothetical protein
MFWFSFSILSAIYSTLELLSNGIILCLHFEELQNSFHNSITSCQSQQHSRRVPVPHILVSIWYGVTFSLANLACMWCYFIVIWFTFSNDKVFVTHWCIFLEEKLKSTLKSSAQFSLGLSFYC